MTNIWRENVALKKQVAPLEKIAKRAAESRARAAMIEQMVTLHNRLQLWLTDDAKLDGLSIADVHMIEIVCRKADEELNARGHMDR